MAKLDSTDKLLDDLVHLHLESIQQFVEPASFLLP